MIEPFESPEQRAAEAHLGFAFVEPGMALVDKVKSQTGEMGNGPHVRGPVARERQKPLPLLGSQPTDAHSLADEDISFGELRPNRPSERRMHGARRGCRGFRDSWPSNARAIGIEAVPRLGTVWDWAWAVFETDNSRPG